MTGMACRDVATCEGEEVLYFGWMVVSVVSKCVVNLMLILPDCPSCST